MELLKFEDFHKWCHPNAEGFMRKLAEDLEVEIKKETDDYLDKIIYVTGVYGGENAQICETMTEIETRFRPYLMFHPKLILIRKELRTIDKSVFNDISKCFGAPHCIKLAIDKGTEKMETVRKESMTAFKEIKEKTLKEMDDYMKECVKDDE